MTELYPIGTQLITHEDRVRLPEGLPTNKRNDYETAIHRQ
jgi:hypothetical protein